MGDENSTLSVAEARHFLRRTGFGAPPAQVAAIANRTRGEVVDELLRFKPSKFRPTGRYIHGAYNSWLKNILARTDRPGIVARRSALQEKLVLFWHDHFATSYEKVYDVKAMGKQNQTLRRNCKGNFRVFLKEINKDPAMMNYLDTIRNTKYSPNENYARELQELFALGVKDFQGNPNYSQEDIVQIARAFTGWDYNNRRVAYFDTFSHNEIDDDGPKVIYTQHGNFGGAGVSFAQPEGETEIDQVIDIILNHTDTDVPAKNTTARYITRKLFTYFAYADPDSTIIDEIIAASGFDTNWDLCLVSPGGDVSGLLREMFVHDAFYETAAAPPLNANSKKSVRWPTDFAIGTLRLLHMRLKGIYAQIGTTGRSIDDYLYNMGQLVMFPPSVFGWDWEENWMTSFTMLSRFRFARDVVSAQDGDKLKIFFRPDKVIDFDALDAIAQNAGPIVDEVLDAVGISDQITAAERSALITYVTEPGAVTSHVDLTDVNVVNEKIRGLFLLALESPASHVF